MDRLVHTLLGSRTDGSANELAGHWTITDIKALVQLTVVNSTKKICKDYELVLQESCVWRERIFGENNV